MSIFGNAEEEELAAAAFASPDAQPSVKNSWEFFNARQRWTLVFVLFLIASSGAIDRAIIAILLEPIKNEFHVSDTALGLLTGISFGIFYAIAGLPIARYADRGDRRILITVSVALWSVLTVGCGMARSFLQLLILRIGVGVGEVGGSGAPLFSLLADYFAPERRARAVGFIQISTIVGAVGGLIAGGYITQIYGWRTALYAAGGPGIVLALIAWLALREPRKQFGAVVQSAKEDAGEPFMDSFRALLKKPTFVNAALGFICYNFVANGAFSFSAAFLQRVLHLSISESGGAAGILSTVAVLAGSVAGGVLADRLSKRDMRWLCLIPAYGTLLALPFYAASFLVPSFTGYLLWGAVGGVFSLGCVPPIMTSMLVVVGAPRRTTGLTIAQMGSSIVGVTCGPIIAGLLSDWLAHSIGPAEGLRWGLTLSLLGYVPASFFMFRAARTIRADMEN